MSSKKPEKTQMILPRIIRMRDAPFYLGVNKNYFNSEIRPYLTEFKLGLQGIAFDRLDLDAWVDELKNLIGKPTTGTIKSEKTVCQKKYLDLSKETTSGTSTKYSKEKEFAKALEQAISKRHNDI